MFSENSDDPAMRRLADIASAFHLISEFTKDLTCEAFPADVKSRYAAIRAMEEACEAALWFDKNSRGAHIKSKYPKVDFRRFGNAGNIFRHQYDVIDYAIVWDNLRGADVAAMESLLQAELPFYRRCLTG